VRVNGGGPRTQLWATIEKPTLFTKIKKIGWFCRFTENQPAEFKIFKIKNPKKSSRHFKNFSQNRIKKFIVFHLGKILIAVKIKKIHFDRSPLTQDHRCLILFDPTSSPRAYPTPITSGKAFLDLQPHSAGGDFQCKSVGKSTSVGISRFLVSSVR
jgi:hypothetical protein